MNFHNIFLTKTIYLYVEIIFLSVILTLDLSPSKFKYSMAEIASFTLLIFLIVNGKLKFRALINCIKPLSPIMFLMLYIIMQAKLQGKDIPWLYIVEIMSGFIPYII